MAAAEGHLECLKLLFENKAEIDAEDQFGRTPKHFGHAFEMKEILGQVIFCI